MRKGRRRGRGKSRASKCPWSPNPRWLSMLRVGPPGLSRWPARGTSPGGQLMNTHRLIDALPERALVLNLGPGVRILQCSPRI